MIVTTTAAHFSFILEEIDTDETPAEYASKKVVVTVENTIIKSPTTPSPVFNIIWAISYSPVKIAAPIPIIYIKMLTTL